MAKSKNVKAHQNAIKCADGQFRKVMFDLNAFCVLEEIYGDIDAAFDNLSKGKMTSVRDCLYAALKTNYPEIDSPEKAGQLLDMANLKSAMQTLTTSIRQNIPDPTGETPKNN